MIWNGIKRAITLEWDQATKDKSTDLFSSAIQSYLESNFGYFYHTEKAFWYKDRIWGLARKCENSNMFGTRDVALLFLMEEVIPSMVITSFEKHGLLSWRHTAEMLRQVVKEEPSKKIIESLIRAIDYKLEHPGEYLDEQCV